MPDAGLASSAPAAPGRPLPGRAGLRGFTSPMTTTFEPRGFGACVSRGTCAVIEVTGELDLAGAPVLGSAVEDLELSAVRDVVLDLRRLSFIDGAGLNAVLDLYAECLSATARLTIIPGPPTVQRVFELTRLDHLLTFSSP